MKGIVKFYNLERKFGFIIEDETETEYYFSHTDIKGSRDIWQGDSVSFQTANAPKGIKAINIEVVNN